MSPEAVSAVLQYGSLGILALVVHFLLTRVSKNFDATTETLREIAKTMIDERVASERRHAELKAAIQEIKLGSGGE